MKKEFKFSRFKTSIAPLKCVIVVSFLAVACLLQVQCTGLRAWFFNYEATMSKSKPKQVIKTLDIKAGQHIADIGAGGGYYSLRFARLVGKHGRVYAVDIDRGFVDRIRKKAKSAKLHNLKAVLATPTDTRLAKNSVDLVFLRATYHHFKDPVSYFRRLAPILKHAGRVAIIEYSPGYAHSGHNMSAKVIEQNMRRAGYVLIETHKFLMPRQSFMIYGRKSDYNY